MSGTTVASLRVAVAGLIVVLGIAHPSAGQAFISPLIGYNFGGDAGCPEITGCEDKSINFGVAVGGLGALFGTELEFAYTEDFFGEIPGVASSVLTLMGNIMIAPRFGPVQPYAVAGLGLIKIDAELDTTELLETDNNHFGWDIGGGLFIFFGEHFGIRGDIRYFHALEEYDGLATFFRDPTTLDYGRVSASAVFRF